ncbi:MAG: hypothetical protein RLZZ15_4074 [Verrucomicrobiota bacterium]|jgi:hypothetical protein
MKSPSSAQRNLAAERHHSFSRRNFLRGVGAAIALPAFESFLPRLNAAQLAEAAATGAVTASGAPLRLAFFQFANGTHPAKWWPTGENRDFALNETMEALAGLKDKIQILGGLALEPATPGPDGAGDHGRAGGSFLTGVRVKKTQGADFHSGISVDQIIAQKAGHVTPFKSLEISCDTLRTAGDCDSGYSCVYQHNMAWSSPTAPVAPEVNPRFLFERLFGTGSPAERKQNLIMRQRQQRSILDYVANESRSIGRELAATAKDGRGAGGLTARDKEKLDQYLTSVREIEQRIERAEKTVGDRPNPAMDTPAGIPASFMEYVRLNMDMLHLAFLTDNTRVATFLLAGEGSNRSFDEIGIPDGHHYCTHHGNKPDLIAKTCVIDKWYATQFAYFLEKMAATKDVDGKSLLDNSMILYGCGNGDGNRHTHANLPIILAGGGGGVLEAGRYVQHQPAPLTNLYLSLMDRMGVKGVERFGDSTGRLANI